MHGNSSPNLLPEYNRGYVAMTDGSLLIVDLKTLQPIDAGRSPAMAD